MYNFEVLKSRSQLNQKINLDSYTTNVTSTETS